MNDDTHSPYGTAPAQDTGNIYGSPSADAVEQARSGRSSTLDPSANVDAPTQRAMVAALQAQVSRMPDGPNKARLEQMLTSAEQTLASGGFIDPGTLASIDSETRHEEAKDLQQGVGALVGVAAGAAAMSDPSIMQGGLLAGLNNFSSPDDSRFTLSINGVALPGSVAHEVNREAVGLQNWLGGYTFMAKAEQGVERSNGDLSNLSSQIDTGLGTRGIEIQQQQQLDQGYTRSYNS
jgi:hypothetical protein